MRPSNDILAKILARPGYTIAASLGGNGALPKLECDTGHEPLAAHQAKEANTFRRLLRIRVYRKRLIDPDNISIKWHVDALRHLRILPDDRQQDVRLIIEEQIKVKTDKEERVEITIERLEEEAETNLNPQ